MTSSLAFPYDCVCYVTDVIDGVDYRASGVIIGPHTILTAAHVVWDTTYGQATDVEVYPGYGPSSDASGIQASAIHYNPVDDAGGYIYQSDSQNDFAVIDVAQNLSAYGSFGVDLNYTGPGLGYISGYPAKDNGADYTQQDTSGTLAADPNYALIDYGSGFNVSPGSSGGPIWTYVDGEPSIVGVVSTSSWGAQLTTADWTQIQGWIASDAYIWSAPFSQTDVVFRDTATGDWGYMRPTVGGGETWFAVGPSSTAYAAIGTGDFNGDGLLDLAFVNTTTGDWGFLTPSGGGETWHDVGPTSTAYAAIAVADFSGDGLTGVAFRNTTTGDMGYMEANPGGGETWHPVGPTSIDYTPLGAGDFNGDGIMDIAFRSNSTGEWGFMSINPGGGETWHDVGPTSLGYQAIGVGEFDGGSTAEIAFRSTATGEWGYMSVNASGQEVWHDVGPTSLAYNAVKVAGFSGDGLSGIAFVNPTTGDFGYMEANPGGGETWHPVGPTSTDYYAIA